MSMKSFDFANIGDILSVIVAEAVDEAATEQMENPHGVQTAEDWVSSFPVEFGERFVRAIEAVGYRISPSRENKF
jgi:hypothetical protein